MGKFLFIGAILLAVLIFGPFNRILKGGDWRVSAGIGAVVAFSAAAFCLVEKRWAGAVALGTMGLWLASSTRRYPRGPQPTARARPQSPPPPPTRSGMSLSEARSILGVDADATVADIRTAYKRLMQKVHPDRGGAPGLAAQLNAARDRLLKNP
jgi:hypothetical protein